MIIRSLLLRNFRNYAGEKFTFSEGINVIRGDNGAGKTNLIEAIYLLTTGRSFRTSKYTDLIKEGESSFYLEILFTKNGIDQTLKMGFDKNEKKITYNATSLPSFASLLGIMPTVLFSPKDLCLIMGSPQERRKFLNLDIGQRDPLYMHHLIRFYRAMKQRNTLLKLKQTASLDPFEAIMAASSVYIMQKRNEEIDKLNDAIIPISKALFDTTREYTLEYKPSISLETDLQQAILSIYKKNREKEFILKSTLIGPHRDDILFTFQDKEAKSFASEGQKRILLSSLRLAQHQITSKFFSMDIPFCIDDFEIHLDPSRNESLLKELSTLKQVFVSTPSAGNIVATKTFEIHDGKAKEPIETMSPS